MHLNRTKFGTKRVFIGERLGLSRLQLLPQDVVDRREFGIGVVGEAFGRDYKTMVRNQPHVRIQEGYIYDLRINFDYSFIFKIFHINLAKSKKLCLYLVLKTQY